MQNPLIPVRLTRRRLMLGAAAAALLAGCGGGGSTGTDIDVLRLTLHEAIEGLNQRRFTAEALTLAYLDQIERHEGQYNAFTALRAEQALQRARTLDQMRAQGLLLGPLAGVPVVIKEAMDWVDAPSTFGWHRLSAQTGGVDLYPQQNAHVVQRLLAAGAIILGKTNIPPFSDDGTRANNSWDGPTFNAVDRDLAPGASSSGSATAVAAGFAAAALGEETGGSIQNPAAAQGLVGVKPTFGLIPTDGITPLAASTRDVAGPIARCVRDAAIMLTVLAGAQAPAGGYTAALHPTALQGRRLGLYGPGWRDAPLAAETQALYAQAQVELQARHATLVADPFAGSGFADLALPDEPYDFRGTESAAYDLERYLPGLGVPSLAALKELVGASPFDEGEPLHWYTEVLPVLQASLSQPHIAPDLSEFLALKAQYLHIFSEVMDAHGLDALVFPQATEPLPGVFEEDAFIAETTVSAINIAGLPAVTVPAGQHASNRSPFSLIFVGRLGSEAQLLAMAYDYEQATGHRPVPVLG